MTDIEKERAERQKRIVKQFDKMRKKEKLASNQAILNAIAVEEGLTLNWVYKLLKKEGRI